MKMNNRRHSDKSTTAGILALILLLGIYSESPGQEKFEIQQVESKVNEAWRIYDDGNIALANQKLERLLPKMKKIYGTNNVQIAAFHVNMGGNYSEVGDIDNSKAHLSEAKKIFEHLIAQPNASHEVFFRYGGYLNNLGKTLLDQGEIGKGIKLFEKALQLHFEKKIPQDVSGKSQRAALYGNLGDSFQKLRQHKKAEEYIRKGVKLDRTLLDGSKQKLHYLASSVANLGVVQQRLGNLDLAKKSLLEAKQLLSKNHPRLLVVLPNLTTTCLTLNEDESARKHADECMVLATKLFEKQPNEYLARAASNLAFVLRKDNSYTEAFKLAIQAEEIRTSIAADQMQTLTEPEAINYCVSHFGLPGLVVSLKSEVSELSTNEAYKSVCRRNGLMHRVLATRKIELKKIVNQNPKTRTRLIEINHALCSVKLDKVRQDALFDERESIMGELVGNIKDVGVDGEPAILKEPIQKLSSLLDENSAFVDIVQYEKFGSDVGMDFESEIHYAAFVLSTRKENVQFVELGHVKKIDQTCRDWLQEIKAGEGINAGKPVSTEIWKPIKESLPPKTKRIFLSCDGMLGQIPWAALHNLKENAPDYLIRDYSFVSVADIESLVLGLSGETEFRRPKNILTIADIDFDEWQKAGHTLPKIKPVGTKIKKTIEKLGRHSVTQVSGRKANVRAVKKLIQSNDIIAIFSHADYEEIEKPRVLRSPTSYLSGGAGRYLLSKSSIFLSYPEKLSGQFVSDMIFDSPKDVILIGCGTGAGPAIADEGIAGFHLAFARAGAKSTVATLWNVNEDVAVDFIKNYLRALSNVENKADAIRIAQLELLHGKGDYSLPKHWAAWSLSGSGK